VINLRTVDLNLLPVFEAVYEERNMTRASRRLAMSQPAVSNAVARLRGALGDELFVPGRRGAAVTPIAEEVYPRVKAALDAVRHGLSERREFVPQESDRRFSVGTLYGPGIIFGKAVADWLQQEAPRLSWRFVQIEDRDSAVARLRDGRLDFLIDHVAPARRELQGAMLFSDEFVVAASGSHPRIGTTLSRKQFLAERHVVHCSLRFPGSVAQIEGALGDRALDVAIEVREPIELPLVVAGTQFIAACNRRLAAPWVRFLGLKLLPLPFRAPPIKGYLVWHASRQRDVGHKWLREGALKLARRLA
jgi:DNA-binding transcriptional LysR family regulator